MFLLPSSRSRQFTAGVVLALALLYLPGLAGASRVSASEPAAVGQVTTGSIAGEVTTSALAPLANVTVQIMDAAGNQVASPVTSADGHFSSSGLMPGTYHARTNNSQGYVDQLFDTVIYQPWIITGGTPIAVTAGGTVTVAFRLELGGTISGRFTDAGTAQPITSNVWVDFFDATGRYVGSSHWTDASGNFTSPGLPAGTYYAYTNNQREYVNKLYNSLPWWTAVTSGAPITVTAGGTTPNIDFALDVGGRIAGRFTDAASGLPLVGPGVTIYDTSGRRMAVWGWGTDGGGNYITQGVPAGSYYVITDNSLGYVNEAYDNIACLNCSSTTGTPVSVTVGATTTGINFALTAGGRIAGRLTDATSGLAITGNDIWVNISDASGQNMGGATPDAAGDFVTPFGLPAGTYYADTDSRLGYVRQRYNNLPLTGSVTTGTPITVIGVATTGGVNFALTPGGRVAGRITAAGTGDGIGGAGVTLFDATGAWVTGAGTDAVGNYTTVVPAGTYYAVTNNSSGYLNQRWNNQPCLNCDVAGGTPIVVTVGTTQPANFALSPGGRIAGRLTDATTGLPITGTDIWVNISDASGQNMGGATPDAAGDFVTPFGLPAGTYYADTDSRLGYVRQRYNNLPLTGSVTSGTPITVIGVATTGGVNFALTVGGGISGRITDQEGGAGVANAWVDFFDATGRHVGSSHWTDGSGTYTSIGLPAGTYYARTNNGREYANEQYNDLPIWTAVTSGTPIVVTGTATTGNIDFALARGGQITGRVTAAATGNGIGGVWMEIYDASGRWWGGAGTDSSGNYNSTGLPAGTYYLRTNNVLGYANRMYADLPMQGDLRTGTPVPVTAGQATTGINFVLAAGGRITGHVTDAATGQPINGINLNAYTSANEWAGGNNSDQQGNYTISLAPGTYKVRTNPNGLPYVSLVFNQQPCCDVTVGNDVVVTAGQITAGIDFALTVGGGISGRITDQVGGAGAANAGVNVYDGNGNHVAGTGVDGSGDYVVSGLSAGSYFVWTYNSQGYVDELYQALVCYDSASCPVTSGTPVAVVAGATTGGINFALTTGGRFGGRVTDATSSTGIAGVWVGIYNPGGANVANRRTDATGTFITQALPPGAYYAKTNNTPGYIDDVFDNQQCLNCTVTTGTPIVVTAGTTLPVNFALDRGAVITGRITDAASTQPVVGNVWVDFFDATGRHVGSSHWTDGSGTYTSILLPAGTYYARTNNGREYVNEQYNNLPIWTAVTSGTPIVVTGTATTGNIDFALARGGQITGRVTDGSGTGISGVWVEAMDAAGRWWGGSSESDGAGNYVTTGFPAGTYFLRTNNRVGYVNLLYPSLPTTSDMQSGTGVAVVMGQTTGGINFTLQAGGSITGTVTSAATGLPLSDANVFVVDAQNRWLSGNGTDQNGVYVLSVPAGTYRAQANPGGNPTYVSQVFSNKPCCDTTQGTPIVVSLGGTVSNINFALATGGRIAGRLTDATTHLPITGNDIWVNISDATGQNWGGASPDSTGNYITSFAVPTGTYYVNTDNRLGYINKRYNDLPNTGSVTSGTPITVTAGATASGIDFALQMGGRIGGRITDQVGGAGAANAGVNVYDGNGSRVTGTGVDGSGNYTVSGLAAGTYFVWTYNSQGYVDQLHSGGVCYDGASCTVINGTPVVVALGATTGNINFALATGGRFGGQVTEAGTTTGLAGASIGIYDANGRNVANRGADGSGNFITQGLPPGTYYARTVNTPAYIDEVFDNRACLNCTVTTGTPIVVTAGTTQPVNFALDRGGVITGHITDADSGQPVAGNIWVDFNDATGRHVGSSHWTDASGTYTSPGLPAGTYYANTNDSREYVNKRYNNLPTWTAATASTPITVAAGGTTPNIDFALDLGGRIAGRFTDAVTGLPLVGPGMSIYDTNGRYMAGWGGADAGGNYVSPGVPAGSYYVITNNSLGYINEAYNDIVCLNCSSTTGTPVSVTVGATTTGINFALAAGGRIAGRLTDATTSLPVTGNDIWVNIYDATGRHMGSASPDATGNFVTSFGLSTGTYYADIDSRLGYIRQRYNDLPNTGSVTSGTPITVTLGATTSGIDFALTVGGGISGRITDQVGGAGVATAGVNVYDGNGNRVTGTGVDGSGNFVVSGLSAGSYYVWTYNSLGYVDQLHESRVCYDSASCSVITGTPVVVALGATTNNINFVLATGGRFGGRVTDATSSTGIAGVWVGIYNAAGASVANRQTDATGTFITQALPPGTYYAKTNNTPGYIDEVFDNRQCLNCTVTTGTPIVVTAGTTLPVNFALDRGAVITGRITDAGSGQPVVGNVWVDFFDATGRHVGSSTHSDASGNYRSMGLPAGTYFARTNNAREYVNEQYNNLPIWTSTTSGTPIAVTAGGTTPNIDFALDIGGRIAGRITDASTGLPLVGPVVAIFDASGRWMASWGTDAGGNYVTPGVPSGTYYARTDNFGPYVRQVYNGVACPNCNPATTGTGIAVVVNTTTTGINFALDVGGQIAGRIVDVSNTPIPGAWVTVFNSSGSSLGWSTNSDATGAYTAYGLPAGSYFVRTNNNSTFVDKLYNNLTCVGCSVTTGNSVSVTQGAATSGIDFVLDQGGSITGLVTDTNGAPVPFVKVRVYNSSNSNIKTATTDASGAYVVNGLPTGTYYVRTSNILGYVDVLHSGVLCTGGACTATTGTAVAVVAGQTSSGINFSLPVGGSIGGTVTAAETGAGLANVPVRIFNSSNSQVASVNTNASGAFSAGGLGAGTYYARTGNTAGYIDQLYSGTTCPNGYCTPNTGIGIAVTLGQTTTGIAFALQPGGGLSGTVTGSPGGIPLANVAVRAYNATNAQWGLATTNALGVYTVTGLPSGTMYARTSNSLGYVDGLYSNKPCPLQICTANTGTPITINTGAITPGIDFVLPLGGTISGTVKDAATNTGVANVTVRVFDKSNTQFASVTTNASGVYSASGLPDGTFYVKTINAANQGYIDQVFDGGACAGGVCAAQTGTPVVVTVGGTNTADFALGRGATISGTVTDGTSALANVGVTVYDSNAQSVWSATTNAAGAYSVSGLPTGTYYAQTTNAANQGFANQVYSGVTCVGCPVTTGTLIAATAGQPTSGINFSLVRGATITGVVTGGGTPAANVEIDLYSLGGRYITSAYTNAAGAYTFGGLTPGTYFVETWARTLGYLDQIYNGHPCSAFGCETQSGTPINLATGQMASGINFALSRGGTTTGTVTDGTSPLANISVTAYANSGYGTYVAVTNAQGVFSIGGLLPGGYFVRTTGAGSQGFVDQLYSGLPCVSCTTTTGTLVPVASGQTVTIGFTLSRGAAITGTVTDGTSPVPNVQVTVYSATGVSAGVGTTTPTGTYVVDGLPPGTYFARTTTAGTQGFVEQVFQGLACPGGSCSAAFGTGIPVTNVGASGIDFMLTRGGTISGLVTVGSVPARSQTVSIFNAAGMLVASPRTSTSGIYAQGGLPAGTYYVRASNSGYAAIVYNGIPCAGNSCTVTDGTPIPVTVGGTSVANFTFVREGASIAGTVTGAGAPLPDVTVALYASNGTSVASFTTSSVGTYLFAGLPAGTYYLRTYNYAGFVDQVYGGLPCVMGYCNPTMGTAVTLTSGMAQGGVDFALTAGGTLSGIVHNLSGDPIADVIVFAWTGHGAYSGYGWSDPTGAYVIRGLPAGTYYALTSRAPNQGYMNQFYENQPYLYEGNTSGTPIALAEGATRGGIDFALPVAGRITGTVTDSTTGSPIPDVAVRVADSTGRRVVTTTSGTDGKYVAIGLTGGSYYVYTENAAGYRNQTHSGVECPLWPCLAGATQVSVTTGDGIDPLTANSPIVNFALTPGSRLEGQVSDAVSGAGIGSVEVLVYTAAGAIAGNGRSDATGRYVVNQGLTPGTYYARTSPFPGYAMQVYSGFACPLGSCDPAMREAITVTGAPRTINVNFRLSRSSLMTVGPTTVADAAIGVPYTATFAASGGTQPYGYSAAEVEGWGPGTPTPGSLATTGFRVARGVLPPGLSLDGTTGVLSGSPTKAGAFWFVIGAVDSQGSSASRLYMFWVEPGPVTITWPIPAPIVFGTALGADQLNATASIPGTFVYTPAAGTVLNVGAGQTLSVTFTPTDRTTYQIVTKTVTLVVTPAGPQTITVTAPNGGESWVVGTSQNITWTSMGGVANVKIEYSINGGTAWATVVATTPNDGSDPRIVPNTPSAHVLVRVSDASNPAVFDVSNAVCSIVANVTELPMGTTANLSFSGDMDWYKFYVPPTAAGQDLKVNVRVTSPYPNPTPSYWHSDLDFELLDGGLRVLGIAISGSDNETLYLPNVAPGWYYINVGYCTTNYADGLGIARYAVTLETGADFGVGYVSGRVVDGSGQGVGGVWVRVAPFPLDPNVSFPTMTTGPDGTFRIAHTPGAHDLYFTGRSDSRNQSSVNVVEEYYLDKKRSVDADHVTMVDGETFDVGTITLDVGAIVSGRVTNASGVGLNLANVAAYDLDGNQRNFVRTDSTGNYTLVGVPVGGATLRFSGSGYATEYYNDKPSLGSANVLPTQSGQTLTGIDVQLGTGGTMVGTVTDAQGTGLAIMVRLYSVLDGIFARASVKSASGTGSFTFSGVLPGDYAIQFDAAGTTYASEWYADAPLFVQATPVTVTAGVTTPGINAQLAVTPVSADMAIVSKTASPSPSVAAGGTITYTINYINNGPGTPGSTSVNDPTPPNTKLVSMRVVSGTGWNVIAAPAVGGTGNIIWRKGSPGLGAANGETAQFEIVVAVDAGAANSTIISNTANAYSIDSATVDGVAGNNSQTVTTTVTSTTPQLNADLAITSKTASPSPSVVAGSNITYTINFVNNGPDTPGSTSVNDPTPPNTKFVSMRVVSGTGWNVIGTPPAVGGTGNIIWRKGSPGLGAASGETAQFEIVVAVDAGTANNTVISNTANAYSIDSATVDGVPANNSKTVTTTAVSKATPVITWANPVAIVHGTALSTTQLNATANVSGTFVYTPAAGTVLGVGAGQTLSVTLTPTDTANYTTATATVGIEVVAAPPVIAGVAPTSGPIGAVVVVTGTGLTGATAVTFNGVLAGYTVGADTQVTATVPAGTITGPIAVTTAGGTATSATEFIVTNQRGTRTLPPCYVPGYPLTVTVDLGPAPGVQAQALEDQPPAGWTLGTRSDGGTWDSVNAKVKWGPFYDAVARAITYGLTPPADTTAAVAFAGIVSFDGVEVPVGGARALTRCETHPADANRDFRLVIGEVTGYGAAWKQGNIWAVPPVPIPIGYVTRAGYLWRLGETYRLDASACPLCWVPLTAVPLPLPDVLLSLDDIPMPRSGPWSPDASAFGWNPGSSFDSRSGAAALAQDGSDAGGGACRARTGTAVRQVAATYTPLVALKVTVAVTPHGDVSAWAVEETVPTGWRVSGVSASGRWDEAASVVRWGPFMDADTRSLRYTLTPTAGATGSRELKGTASFDGEDVVVTGVSTIQPAPVITPGEPGR